MKRAVLRGVLGTVLGLSAALGQSGPEPLPVERYAEGHPVQEAFLGDEDSRQRVLICGRRTGKTMALIIAAVLAMQKWAHEPDVWVVYISKTAKIARKQFWRPLKRVLQDSNLKYRANETELSLELAGGGGIMLGGADDISQIEKFRGFALSLAIVDECGTYPSMLLQMLIEDILEPATADIGGRLVFAGTPGPTLSGTWYELSGPEAGGANDGVYRGDLRSNPHLRRDLPPEERPAAIDEILQNVREARGWSETHPTYVREWLGLWAQDDEALVFPLSANDNYYRGGGLGPWGLPAETDKGHLLTVSDWKVVIGMDVGYSDANAYSVVATHPDIRRSFVVEVRKERAQLIDDAAATLRELREKYAVDIGGRQSFPAVVVDSGGMGKIHAETLRRRMGIQNEAASKRDKASSISVTRDDVKSGRLQVLPDQAQLLIDEWQVLVWAVDDNTGERKGIKDGQEDHATDATLYALRRLRDYTRAEPVPGPKKGSKQWQDEREARMLRQARQAARRRRKGRGVAV